MDNRIETDEVIVAVVLDRIVITHKRTNAELQLRPSRTPDEPGLEARPGINSRLSLRTLDSFLILPVV